MSDVLFNKNPLTESIYYEVCKTYKLESEDLSREVKILNRLFMNQGH